MNDTFLIDNQTIDDLQLFESPKYNRSVYAYFDYTTTLGGKTRLKELFQTPLRNIYDLQTRVEDLRFLYEEIENISFQKEPMDFIEFYFANSDSPKKYSFFRALKKSIQYQYKKKQEQYNKQRGLIEILDTISFLNELCQELQKKGQVSFIKNLSILINTIYADAFIRNCLEKNYRKLKGIRLERCDYLIRKIYRQEIRDILNYVYQLDAYYSVALAAKKHSFSFPQYIQHDKSRLELKAVFHPFLHNPIVNDFSLTANNHLCFLTGVNMSGKSTLMKSIAIATYLAHIGFPIPAKKMTTGLFNGLLTTINLADDLTQGRSHFYNEVLRVKFVAQELSTRKNLLIIFDELFRGTNVKDAYECSLLIVEAFSKHPNSLFVISSHLVEIAHNLKDITPIQFKHFQTQFGTNGPTFNHILLDGITSDRIGTWLLKNEGILEMLNDMTNNNDTGH